LEINWKVKKKECKRPNTWK